MHYGDFVKVLEDGLGDLLVEDTRETQLSLGLPHSYFVASNERVEGFDMPHMYYWDSYFIARGVRSGRFKDYDIGLAENMLALVDRLGFVPNSNSFQHLSRSQPPLLARLVADLIEEKRVNEEWQRNAYPKIKTEYENVWVSIAQPHIRRIHPVLSRYYDSNVLHSLAEAESGWDYTDRFSDRALDFLPVDLNALLFIYEQLLERLAQKFEPETVLRYQELQHKRIEAVNQLMWNEQDGLYYDFDYGSSEQGTVKSLAAYVPMFAGMASPEQAQRLRDNLHLFETEYGLTCTDIYDTEVVEKQWTAPNGWAPLHYMVCEGLERYGFEDDARRIAKKWVDMVMADNQNFGHFKEKYNVAEPEQPPKQGLYPDQIGFGWTNGVTKYFIEKYFLN